MSLSRRGPYNQVDRLRVSDSEGSCNNERLGVVYAMLTYDSAYNYLPYS
jgi:hypothetical protein